MAAERLLLAQAGIPWTVLAIALPWAAVAVVAALRWRQERAITWRADQENEARPPVRFAVARDLVVAAVLVVWVAGLVWQATNQPLAGWDAWAFWFLKGRAFYETGTVQVSTNGMILFPNPDYPQLVPLTIAGTYAWTGDLDTLMKAWWPLLAGAAAAGLYWGPAGLVGVIPRLMGTLLLTCLPELWKHAVGYYAGYADLPLAVFTLFGGVFLYRWLRYPDMGAFSVAALFFSLAGFTKNEGIIVAGIGLGLLTVLAMMRRRCGWGAALGAAACAAAIVFPWQLQRQILEIPVEFQPTWAAVTALWPQRIGPILSTLGGYLSNPAHLNHLWPVLPVLGFAALVVAPRRWLLTLPLLLLVAAQAAAGILAYVGTPRELMWHLGTSIDRVVFHSVPMTLLLGTLYIGLLVDGQQPWRRLGRFWRGEPAPSGRPPRHPAKLGPGRVAG